MRPVTTDGDFCSVCFEAFSGIPGEAARIDVVIEKAEERMLVNGMEEGRCERRKTSGSKQGSNDGSIPREEWRELWGLVIEAIKPYPQAYEAVLQVLRNRSQEEQKAKERESLA